MRIGRSASMPAASSRVPSRDWLVVQASKIQSCLSTARAARHIFHIYGNLDVGNGLPCRTTRRDTARVALSAVCLCVPRNAGHVTERPCRGIILAKNAVAGGNYCCVRVGRTTPRHCLANKRRGETIGTIRRGKSAIHFIAGFELGFIARPDFCNTNCRNSCVMPLSFEATNRP